MVVGCGYMVIDFGWFVGGCKVDCDLLCMSPCFVVRVVCRLGDDLPGIVFVDDAFVLVCVVCLCAG